MRILIILAAYVTAMIGGTAQAQDRSAVRQWIHDQVTEYPIEYYPVGTNCCDEADGRIRFVEYLGDGRYMTYDDDDVTPLYFRENALGVKHDSPFFQWFVYVINHRVICARKPQTGG